MELLQKIFIEDIGLDEEHYLQFKKISKVVVYSKKDFLLKEGSICSFLGFVEKGIVRSYLKKDSKEFNNDFYAENTFVTAFRSFLMQKPAYSTIQALSETTIHYLTYQQLQQLQNLDNAWYKFGKYIAEQFYIRKCKKETSLLLHSAKERYDTLINTFPKIEQLVPQYQIASFLRIEPESLSRLKALTYIKEK